MEAFALFVFIYFFGAIVMAVFGYDVAKAKGLSAGLWGIFCFIFGPIALLAVAGMPSDKYALMRRRIEQGKSKICPECGEGIRAVAKICPYCRTPQTEQTGTPE